MKNKVVIIAPFWNDPEHVGMYRVKRFFDWLRSQEYEIIIISVGSKNSIEDYDWGKEIRISDPLKIYRKEISSEGKSLPVRKGNKYRRFIAYLFMIPDPLIVWVRRVYKNSYVIKTTSDAMIIISSSPPESSHVLAYKLSKRVSAKLFIDLRDGWLDEPLKDVLRIPLRNALEKSIEKKILTKSDRIFVTSEKWKILLINRISGLKDRVTILTNGYPYQPGTDNLSNGKAENGILLIHAGKFKAGRRTHSINLLLNPLYFYVGQGPTSGTIILLGELTSEEINEVELWKKKFAELNWVLTFQKQVIRSDMMKLLQKADGLLLLSASLAPIPSKVFEYIPTRKPILAITAMGSAVWKFAVQISQMSVIDMNNFKDIESQKAWDLYFQNVKSRNYVSNVPDEYSESELKRKFLNTI